ncbi:hypothetical protein BASA81_001666 [Batrachochytrium salamandrivorans]|nr:hypothetical protein BASA81_001666 [Batrachochytrium salamandrivorans]
MDDIPEVTLEKCKKELKNFRFRDDTFLRILEDGKSTATYVHYDQRSKITRHYHESLAHLNANSTNRLREFIHLCQFDQSPPVALPFERWGIDFYGPMAETKSGNRYLITCIDYATRWVLAKPVKEMTESAVAAFLYDLMMTYGAPFEIISDRGKSFLAEGIDLFERENKIRHLATTPYHPQTNGMVERMHAMLGHGLTTLTNESRDRWDEFLPQTLLALRTRTHAVTGFSPFYLMFGIHPRLPYDETPPRSSLAPLDDIEQMEENSEFIARNLEEVGQARSAANVRTKAQAKAMRNVASMKTLRTISSSQTRIANWLASWKGSNYSRRKTRASSKAFPGPVPAQSQPQEAPQHIAHPLPQFSPGAIRIPARQVQTEPAESCAPFSTSWRLVFLNHPSRYNSEGIKVATAGTPLNRRGCVVVQSHPREPPDNHATLNSWPGFQGPAEPGHFQQRTVTVQAAADIQRLTQGKWPREYLLFTVPANKADLDWNEAALIHRWTLGSKSITSRLKSRGHVIILNDNGTIPPHPQQNRYQQTPSQRLPPVSAPTNPMMMDLDATRRGPITPQERDRRFQGKLCFRCGKEGHFRAECPLGARRQVSAVNTLTEFPALTPSISENDHSQ